MDETERRRRAGHAFIERAWPVLPLVPGESRPMACRQCNPKSPEYVGDHGFEDCPHEPDYCHSYKSATLDHGRFDSWLDRSPNANLGIATEAARLVVIDCDTAAGHKPITAPEFVEAGATDGEDVFGLAIARYKQPWPKTLTVTTPSGGAHYYFRIPAGLTIRTRTAQFGPLVDVKSAAAYIVAPTSRKPAGEYRRCGGPNGPFDPAPAPAWLLHHLRVTGHMPEPARPRPSRPRMPAPDGDRGVKRLDAIAYRLETTTSGRHDALRDATWAAAHLVAEGLVAEDHAYAVIRDAALVAEREERKINDAWRSALRKTGASLR